MTMRFWFTNIIKQLFSYAVCTHSVRTQFVYGYVMYSYKVNLQILIYLFQSNVFQLNSNSVQQFTLYSSNVTKAKNFPYFIKQYTTSRMFLKSSENKNVLHTAILIPSLVYVHVVYHVTFLRREQNKIEKKKESQMYFGKTLRTFPVAFPRSFSNSSDWNVAALARYICWLKIKFFRYYK